MSKFLVISWREQVTFWWDDNDTDVCFVLDQHAQLDYFSDGSLKQQSVGRHVTPLGHIILILSQPPTVFALTSYNNATCLAEKQQISIFIVFGLNPHSTTFETSTLTITPTMRFEKKERVNTVHFNINQMGHLDFDIQIMVFIMQWGTTRHHNQIKNQNNKNVILITSLCSWKNVSEYRLNYYSVIRKESMIIVYCETQSNLVSILMKFERTLPPYDNSS